MSASKIKCIYFRRIFPQHDTKSGKRIAKLLRAICAGRGRAPGPVPVKHSILGRITVTRLCHALASSLTCHGVAQRARGFYCISRDPREEAPGSHLHVKPPSPPSKHSAERAPSSGKRGFSWAERRAAGSWEAGAAGLLVPLAVGLAGLPEELWFRGAGGTQSCAPCRVSLSHRVTLRRTRRHGSDLVFCVLREKCVSCVKEAFAQVACEVQVLSLCRGPPE